MRFRRTLVIATSMTLLATGIALGQGAGGGTINSDPPPASGLAQTPMPPAGVR